MGNKCGRHRSNTAVEHLDDGNEEGLSRSRRHTSILVPPDALPEVAPPQGAPVPRSFLADKVDESRLAQRHAETALDLLPKYPTGHLHEAGPVPPRHIVLRAV
eukprot:TRINITY_DN21230_c0_g1_i1.p1 TRINITY_DN21230_c0_g1~~TRINITY_DN21230_c0_g1_i1.p1  ORF type:complete len:103 (+),score=8.82 TRINITY_DN21230_c0_g1_i1:43-351(+)